MEGGPPFEKRLNALEVGHVQRDPFGLSASVWTRDLSIAHKMARRIKDETEKFAGLVKRANVQIE